MVSIVQLPRKVVRLDVQAGRDRLRAGIGRGRQRPTPGRRLSLALLQLRSLVSGGAVIERSFFTHAVVREWNGVGQDGVGSDGGGRGRKKEIMCPCCARHRGKHYCAVTVPEEAVYLAQLLVVLFVVAVGRNCVPQSTTAVAIRITLLL